MSRDDTGRTSGHFLDHERLARRRDERRGTVRPSTIGRARVPCPARAAIERAINPADYECGPSELDVFVDSLVAEMTQADLAFLTADEGLVLNIPTYDALIFGSDTDSSYGLPADYDHLLTKSFRDAKRFWNIQSDDIQLHAMHGDMLLDTARVARPLVLFGETEAEAAACRSLPPHGRRARSSRR